MSTDNLSVAILEDFIKKTRLAVKSGQKEMKFSIQDAESIVHNLSIILLRLAERDTRSNKEEVIQVVMDGGGLDDKR